MPAKLGGFRVAAGIGYEAQNSSPTQTVQLDNGARNLDNEWSASLAFMHVATGLFVQGQYCPVGIPQRRRRQVLVGAGRYHARTGSASATRRSTANTARRRISSGPALPPLAVVPQLRPTSLMPRPRSLSGVIGVVQQIDAAAMELYLGWRRFDTSVSGILAGDAVGNGSSDLDLVHGGARIRF